jgi:small subunit ribosomal protein S2
MIDISQLPDKAPEYDLRDLLEAGCHFGHQINKWHPKMAEYIYMAKDGIHIFDLAKTANQIRLAYNFAYSLGAQGKVLIMVGTKRQAKECLIEAAKNAGALYITSRWLGGMLTNWPQVKKSLKRMLDLEKGLATGAYDSYTKYERVQFEKEMNRMKRFFVGVETLKDLPDALFVVDPVREKIAVKEALLMGIPVIGLADSNADPRQMDIAIPANDDALGSVKLIVDAVAAGYSAGKQSRK